jgi:hypothetical protein
MATPRKIVEQRLGDPAQASTEPAPVRDQRNALESLGAELLRRAEESQPVLEAAWDELMARWGVRGQPIGIQRVRERIQGECGSEPEDNALSRELITLREEHRP